MVETQQHFSRQILAFGAEGQKAIMNTRVGIVGAGGIGSCIIQMLSYLGVREFMILDDDLVEESNLNRLVGALPEDVAKKARKVEVARRYITSINPNATIITLGNLRSEEAIEGLSHFPDVIFGCVDNDSARMILADLAAAYEKTLIDCATEIEPKGDNIDIFGGRVVICRPGDFCLWCADQIDDKVAKQELESKEEGTYRRNHGYGLGKAVPAPAVISLNMIIAGLAVTEFLMLVTKIREPERMLTYKGMERGKVTSSNNQKKPDCFICNYLRGKKEKANLVRYIRSDLPKDLPK